MRALVIDKLTIRFALWRAARHTRLAAWWNDIAESFLTGESVATIRARRKDSDA
jgi:hypothetical protein